jgi:hypothetical protein
MEMYGVNRKGGDDIGDLSLYERIRLKWISKIYYGDIEWFCISQDKDSCGLL